MWFPSGGDVALHLWSAKSTHVFLRTTVRIRLLWTTRSWAYAAVTTIPQGYQPPSHRRLPPSRPPPARFRSPGSKNHRLPRAGPCSLDCRRAPGRSRPRASRRSGQRTRHRLPGSDSRRRSADAPQAGVSGSARHRRRRAFLPSWPPSGPAPAPTPSKIASRHCGARASTSRTPPRLRSPSPVSAACADSASARCGRPLDGPRLELGRAAVRPLGAAVVAPPERQGPEVWPGVRGSTVQALQHGDDSARAQRLTPQAVRHRPERHIGRLPAPLVEPEHESRQQLRLALLFHAGRDRASASYAPGSRRRLSASRADLLGVRPGSPRAARSSRAGPEPGLRGQRRAAEDRLEDLGRAPRARPVFRSSGRG